MGRASRKVLEEVFSGFAATLLTASLFDGLLLATLSAPLVLLTGVLLTAALLKQPQSKRT